MSTKRSHILKQTYSFQLQVCSSIVTFKWTPGTEGLMESRKKYIPVEVMIRKVSQVSSCFRIFIWILVLISQCLDISFCFANVICWTGAITFIDFTSGVRIFVFQTEKTSDFFGKPHNCSTKFVVNKYSEFIQKLFTVFSLFTQKGTST